ncbi:hypothetical protein [Nostoc sp. MS1]|uniref:hypothetical protein n=1 Tax=Nostoc sp. MS1 TaxID=2764711 RepID=UPI001CC6193F|nr:hypothetical protein [Nostoc sp. MS1]BCL38285.1 hypothetical protein NSMS1_47320 [Nostoc sp. MS1]
MTRKIEKKQLDNIATWMKPVKETDLPSVLAGVFFMDGNPLPDDCITMYNLEWDIQKQTLILPVFAPLQWTFHNTIFGWLLLSLSRLFRFTYKIEFADKTLQHGQITPFLLGLQIPKWFIDATMHQEENSPNGNVWYRKTRWFGGLLRLGEYTLRKVVDKDGNYTPAFKEMLAKVKNDCLVIVCENQSSVEKV